MHFETSHAHTTQPHDLAVSRAHDLKVKAYAGAGKTSTLRMIADRLADQRGNYLAFNKDIATEAKRKFPGNVTCRTVHSLAFSSVDRALTAKLNLAKEPPHHLASRYGLGPVRVPTVIGKDGRALRVPGRAHGCRRPIRRQSTHQRSLPAPFDPHARRFDLLLVGECLRVEVELVAVSVPQCCRAAWRMIAAPPGARCRSSLRAAGPYLISIFLTAERAEAVFGRRSVKTPLSNFASTLSTSTPSGSGIVRVNEPYDRSSR
jgi:hypothetical protein